MMKINKSVSVCCWADWYNDVVIRCCACGNSCRTIKLTTKMVNQATQLEKLCRQKGYKEED